MLFSVSHRYRILFFPLACLVCLVNERSTLEVIKCLVNFMVVRASYKWETEVL